MDESRTKNSIRNIFWGTINKAIVLLAPFILRTVILNVLGAEYLGLNGLFSSILQLLNLTELGFTSAIVYSLYGPIANKDIVKTAKILNLIKRTYQVIGISIFVIGIAVLPFLEKIVKGGYPNNLNIKLLFVLYLLNVSVSYLFFAHRNCLLTASQRSDVKSTVNSLTKVIELFLQIVVLQVSHNIFLYVSIQVVCTIMNNVIVYFLTRKMYPDYFCGGDLDKSEKKAITLQIFGILADKICCVSRTSFDSIFISIYFGLEIVAKYENYAYITNALYSVINMLVLSLIASVANCIATKTKDANYQDMKQLEFIFAWICGWCSITLLCLYQPFIELWMGKEMLFPADTMILFVFYFYVLCMGLVKAIYVQATGIWWKERYRAVFETASNLVLNIILVSLIGLKGIILGTCISLFFVNYIYGSRYIFKYYFVGIDMKEYFLERLKYIIVTIFLGVTTWGLSSMVDQSPLTNLIGRGIICVIVPNAILLFIIRKTKYWVYFSNILQRITTIK